MLHQEYKGPHMTPGGVKGQGPLWKSGGSTPKAINLQEFRGILKLLLSAFTVNLKKKKSINVFNHSINNKWSLLSSSHPNLHWKTLPCISVVLFCFAKVSELVGALSQVSHRELHQGYFGKACLWYKWFCKAKNTNTNNNMIETMRGILFVKLDSPTE